jgi:hypothetical protein
VLVLVLLVVVVVLLLLMMMRMLLMMLMMMLMMLMMMLMLMMRMLLRRASGLTLSPGRAASPYECAKTIPAQSGQTESSRPRPEPAHEPGQ